MSVRRRRPRLRRPTAHAALPERLRQSFRDRSAARRAAGGRNSPQRCRLTACTRSSSPAPPSPRRATPTGAAGCIASARRPCTAAFRAARRRPPQRVASTTAPTPPNQLRWDPPPLPRAPTDFVDGLAHAWRATAPRTATSGCAIHWYVANRSMQERFFYDADGELLIVPQQGALRLADRARACSSRAARDRGDSARPALPRRAARRQRARLRLRELRRAAAPAGSRADRLQRPGQPARLPDARSPGTRTATGDFELVAKFCGNLWTAPHRSFAARRGRLARQLRALQVRPAPLQHDRLGQLRSSGSVDLPGAAVGQRHARASITLDFVIFPPRWLVMEDTFRPPWFHRNVASEFMGLIARRLRRQGGGLRAGRRLAAQLHERARTGRGDLREGERAPTPRSRWHITRHHGLHVRDAHA